MSPYEIVVVIVESFKSCLTLCNPTDCSTGFPVLEGIPEFAQTHVHLDSDGTQPSHPMSPPSLSAFKLSQPHSLFQWVGSEHQVAKVLELQLQHRSFQWIFRVDFLWDWLVWSPCCPRDSQESFPVPQFERTNSSVMRKWRHIAKIVWKWLLNSIYVGWKEIIILSKFIHIPSTPADISTSADYTNKWICSIKVEGLV